jgi:hypothetical protein
MFTNKQINGSIYESRYIASWLKSGGELYYVEDVDNFKKWLLSIGLTEEEARHTVHLATCGKLELEVSAKNFLDKLH